MKKGTKRYFRLKNCSLYWYSTDKPDANPRGQISDLRTYALFVYNTKPLLMNLIPQQGTKGKFKSYSLLARSPGLF